MNEAEGFAPGRLWSLWDMIEVQASALFLIGEALQSAYQSINMEPVNVQISGMLDRKYPERSSGFFGLFSRIIIEKRPDFEKTKNAFHSSHEMHVASRNKNFRSAIRLMDVQFQILDLDMSSIMLARIKENLEISGEMPTAFEINNLSVRIRDELESRQFLSVEKSRLWAYQPKQGLFGQIVATTFPSASYDIDEAGKCYAMGRWTACAFHLMRTVEVGIQYLCGKLAVTYSSKGGWLKLIGNLEPAINVLPELEIDERAYKKSLQQARAHLHAIRLAWRNDAMHPKDTYTDEEAGELLRHVETFMKHLASLINRAS